MHALMALIALAVLWIWTIQPAFAQIPDGARSYQRQYTRIARSEWGIDAPIASLAAQIAQESGWRDGLTSRVGAKGLAQFMPATAKWMNEMRPDLAGDALYSPAWSMRSQVAYMKWLRARITADDECQRMGFAFQSYNSGLGWVYKRQKLSRVPGQCFRAACNVNPGVLASNQQEAQDYPLRIEHHWAAKFRIAGWGGTSCNG